MFRSTDVKQVVEIRNVSSSWYKKYSFFLMQLTISCWNNGFRIKFNFKIITENDKNSRTESKVRNLIHVERYQITYVLHY